MEIPKTLLNETSLFLVLDLDIELFQSETEYGLKTAALISSITEFDKKEEVIYLNSEDLSLETAVKVYQMFNDCVLSKSELESIYLDNLMGFE
jgi:hypothetical protein